VYYSKIRIMQQLLPLLKAAMSLARVVVVGGGGYEGPIDTSDLAAMRLPITKVRGHLASMLTLSIEHLAAEAPTVGFMHDFPGAVQTQLLDDLGGALVVLSVAVKTWTWLGTSLGLRGFVPIKDSGERHVFLATSEAFKAKEGTGKGVPLIEGVLVQRGTDGVIGSGTYSVNLDCESVPVKVDKLLDGFRTSGVSQQVWEYTTGEFDRITSVAV
jgi:hypothetical protein